MTFFAGIDGGSFLTGLLLGFTICTFLIFAAIRWGMKP